MKNIIPKALEQLIGALEEIEEQYKVKYYLVGGILVNIYTVFRITQDIDFVVDIQSQNISINQYISMLKNYNFIPMQDWQQAGFLAQDTNMLQYFDQNERVKFYNYIIDRLSQNKYKKLGPIGLKRRVREKLFGIECWVASKEDFIISKLTFGGWQDFSDALGCWMRFAEMLDINYIEMISKQLAIEKEFNLLKSGIEDPDEFYEKLISY